MKLKSKPSDFRVTELLKDDYLTETGKHHVYKVTKRKLTSLEAAEIVADMANVRTSDVSMAGLKDRQGVTSQFMSFPGGKRVALDTPELKIESVGCAKESLSSANSYGNAFEVRLRDLTPVESRRLIAHKQVVARLGVPNYFDEQRFGNLKHGQGWVAKELMLGRTELALKNLLCAESQHDAGRMGSFKEALRANWGDWSECRDIAGRFGEHHSVFDALRKDPADFAGAFFHISSRLRLIHLYAFQSHIWNRAVAAYFAKLCGDNGARVAYTLEGPQIFPDGKLEVDESFDGAFRLPGVGLEDVEHPEQRRLLAEALADEGLLPAQFKISGISGFQLKGEDRRLFIRPRHLKISDGHMTGEMGDSSILKFELPRGAYATLVVRGLLARFAKGSVDPKGAVVSQHNPDDERNSKDVSGWKAKAAARSSYGQRATGATGGWLGGPNPNGERHTGGGRQGWHSRHEESRANDNRNADGGGQRQGGWQGRDDNRGGGSYGGGQRQGGYQGGNDSRGGGRSYGGGQSQGGYQGRDDNRGGGSNYGGGGQRQGGWQGRDDNRGGGGRSYGGGQSQGGGQGQGGWQGRDDNRGGGGRSYGGGQSQGGGQGQGGYQGRDDNRGGGSYGGGGGQRQGGYQGGNDNRGGGRSYGGGQSQGGYQGRDDNRGGGSYGGGQRQGGYQGGNDNRGGGRSYGGGQSQGGYQGRDDNRGGGSGYGGGGQRQGGYQGGSDNRGGGRSYGGGQGRDDNRGGGGQRQGGWQGRDDNRGGGERSQGGAPHSGGWKSNRAPETRWSKEGQDSGRTSGGYNREGSEGGGAWGGGGRSDSRGGGGGYQGGGGRSSYGGGGQRQSGGYQGRDDNRGGGGRSSYGGGGQRQSGGYQGRDDNRGGGSYGGGGGGGARPNAWGKRDDSSGGDRSKGKVWEGANVEPPKLDTRPKSGPSPDSTPSSDS